MVAAPPAPLFATHDSDHGRFFLIYDDASLTEY